LSDAGVLLLVAVSARALAVAARRAGYAAVAVDAFGDLDARALCREMDVVENGMGGFAGIDLEPVVARLCAAHAPVGVVYGSGFEDCPDALATLARRAPLFGSSPRALRRAKDPEGFAAACAAAGLAHPEVRRTPPPSAADWLVKRRGGAGGLHVAPASAERAPAPEDYWQRQIPGRMISLLFVRDPQALTPIAWSEQWTAPAEGTPYRYGGAAGPLDFEPDPDLTAKLAALTQALGLRGLASADFIDDGERLWLLEINPRPGATLDVFDDDADPLLARHIAASADRPAPPVIARRPRAAEIVYADADLVVPAGDWPDWAADRSPGGTAIPAGAPVCTVLAGAGGAAEAKALVHQRSRRIRAWLNEDVR
jgi:predicted ATP-grasp superfamily ATP-dependent carboligase